jgi:GT2 family glycosyltransferase
MLGTSIIIVTYNSERDIAKCLDSVISHAGPGIEIIVVDNGSTDGTMQALELYRESVTILSLASNLGYAKANNIGFTNASGNSILLLNPDTVVQAGALKEMVSYLERHPDIVVLAPLIRNPDGSPQHSVRRFPGFRMLFFELLGLSRLFPRSKAFNSWRIPEFDFSALQEIAQPMAAALLLRRSFFKDVLMDERFVMFFNDVDLCRRVWDGGGKIVFYPDAAVVHRRGASTAKVRERMIPLHTRGFMDYMEKYRRSILDSVLCAFFAPVMILNAMLRIFLLRFFGIDL